MKEWLLGGLAAGTLTVLICTSAAFEEVRQFASFMSYRAGKLLNCCFCTSWWISIAMLKEFTLVEWASTVALANITVLLIHMAISTVPEDEQHDADR